MHTVKVIACGLLLLPICLGLGRFVGTSAATSCRIFIALWLIVSLINLWLGVERAGYTVSEEIPYFLIAFLIPTAVGLFIWWKYG